MQTFAGIVLKLLFDFFLIRQTLGVKCPFVGAPYCGGPPFVWGLFCGGPLLWRLVGKIPPFYLLAGAPCVSSPFFGPPVEGPPFVGPPFCGGPPFVWKLF